MQPDLRNCTWYRERSCCRQAELESIFKKVKPLQGASENCMRHLNYMICWVCDPLQYNFYSNGWRRLKMCASFCDAVLNACKDAKLKGDYVGVLYPTGAEFCKSRRFDVALNDKDCFSYNGRMPRSDPRWGPSSNAGPDLESFSYLFMLFLCIQFYHRRNVLL
ncbi:hypothetical protein RvY_05936-2 [Ramazzottius varieornatus]|uniref:Folate receptor-like domain-containing protein n=1 Tax=Ramazzottius varieornatus TaxID=947166 RepID=A0A1D1UWU8_RAMVA|nr:hypothetical protein RvY_05936-2 [Ramazzottius varieornatus]